VGSVGFYIKLLPGNTLREVRGGHAPHMTVIEEGSNLRYDFGAPVQPVRHQLIWDMVWTISLLALAPAAVIVGLNLIGAWR
jgi:hypothetical protein